MTNLHFLRFVGSGLSASKVTPVPPWKIKQLVVNLGVKSVLGDDLKSQDAALLGGLLSALSSPGSVLMWSVRGS